MDADGSARARRSSRSTPPSWIPGLRRGPHRPDDRDPTGLVHLAPAHLGRADPRRRLLGLLREARRTPSSAIRASSSTSSSCSWRKARTPGSASRTATAATGPTPPTQERLERLRPAGVACPRCGKRDGLTFHEHIVDVWFESGVSHSAVLGATREPALARRPLPRGARPVPRLVPLVPARRGQRPRARALPRGRDPRLHARRRRTQDVQVAGQRDLADRRRREARRRDPAHVGLDGRLPRGHAPVRRDPRPQRRGLSQDPQHLPLPAGQPERTSTRGRDRVPYDEMEELDRWALQQLESAAQAAGSRPTTITSTTSSTTACTSFCAVTLSSFYLDIIKDRLYTFPREPSARGARRRRCCTGWPTRCAG